MGMDVYGVNATSEVGGYFRRNVWGWRPLADYILDHHYELTDGCDHWHTNDGDGLDAQGSLELAAALQQDVDNGFAAAVIVQRDAQLKDIPKQECNLCAGTGIRKDKVGVEMGHPTKVHPVTGKVGWCNGCDGEGYKSPMETWYSLELDDIKEFIAFLNDCGGFEIC